jgi:uncharacterized protein (DUF983 family)|tara:strand:- start:739 stop:972 length:234 start_codon:yes stop_codon:yes gene_type:complete
MDGFGKGPFGTKVSIAAQVTNGVCPTCTMEGVFVSLTPEIYRCITCGADCRQYINGQIRYLPAITKAPDLPLNGQKT